MRMSPKKQQAEAASKATPLPEPVYGRESLEAGAPRSSVEAPVFGSNNFRDFILLIL
jgi:hypothetical protein